MNASDKKSRVKPHDTMNKLVGALALYSLSSLPALASVTFHETSTHVNELQSGTASFLDSKTSNVGAHLTSSSGTFSAEAFVDQVNSTTAPTLRVKSQGSTTGAYNDPNRSTLAIGIAQTTTVFRATSGTQPFETSFGAGFSFDIDGTMTFDVGNPSGTDFNPFRPGDQGSVSFSLLIRPESDAYSESAPTISMSSEIYWDEFGVGFGDLTIYEDGNNAVGTATLVIDDLSATQKMFTISGSSPFTALVGVDYQMESYFQAGTTLRGGTGDKSIVVDFFNSMNASPVADDGGFGFVAVPEPSFAGMLMISALGTLMVRRVR